MNENFGHNVLGIVLSNTNRPFCFILKTVTDNDNLRQVVVEWTYAELDINTNNTVSSTILCSSAYGRHLSDHIITPSNLVTQSLFHTFVSCGKYSDLSKPDSLMENPDHVIDFQSDSQIVVGHSPPTPLWVYGGEFVIGDVVLNVNLWESISIISTISQLLTNVAIYDL